MLATSTRPVRTAATTVATVAFRPHHLASSGTTTGLRSSVASSASYKTAAASAPRCSQQLAAVRFAQRSSNGSAWAASSSPIAARIPRAAAQTQLRTAANEARVGATTSSNAQSGANLAQTTKTSKGSSAPSSATATGSINSHLGGSTSNSSSGRQALAPNETLTWNRFLGLRKTRRRIGLVASVASAVAATAAGANIMMAYDLDTVGAATLGMDSIFVMGLGVVASGGVGWLAGPAVGDAVFKVLYRRLGPQIAQKEAEFFRRIKKFRVDPTSSSLNNPVPDYYGEKIGSVGDYRRWLKDQRAFNLKTSGRARGAAAGRVALRKKGE
ncbi:uncharacterized protein K452DRAFT_308810 [Aplosporella prunicola CBS 121167]|uniref:Presequence translocated-associated motor subunit PAM17 n=1 Tax=Aplosporella prunicola CBS 121167 TaxID=1176127 RepID=A0A6A6BBX3_9PEZI|nr:uncharacterized protein K452DRAFT_308810 [Aplosporella prunicola CBS 121167]KAF2141742.1 hypothetical protein K452DRAFT_308810 [Aplosporella prunicola CBS 121167]